MHTSIVSVVIPAYNEQDNIGKVLLEVNATMETLGLPYEVIVVNDGSTDKTRLRAMQHKATVLSNEINKGKGYTLKKGLQNANGDMFVVMDADGSHQTHVPIADGVYPWFISWSPYGTSIAITSMPYNTVNAYLWIIDISVDDDGKVQGSNAPELYCDLQKWL